MSERYINVSILDFGNGDISCRLTQSVDNGPLESTPISLDKARKLQWELKLIGGSKEVYVSSLDRTIVSKNVSWLMQF